MLTLIAVVLIIYVALMWFTVRRVRQRSHLALTPASISLESMLVEPDGTALHTYDMRQLKRQAADVLGQLARTPERIIHIEGHLAELQARVIGIDAAHSELLKKLDAVRAQPAGAGFILGLANLGAEIFDTQWLAALVRQVARENAGSLDERFDEITRHLQAIEAQLTMSTQGSISVDEPPKASDPKAG